MKTKLNILVSDLVTSQLGFFAIQVMNVIGRECPNIQPIAFCERILPPSAPTNFACLHMSHAWLQDGIGIATCPITATRLLNMEGLWPKYYYVWDLPWLRGRHREFGQFFEILTDERMQLIARSMAHANAIKNAYNREVKYILEDFNPSGLLQCLNL